MQASILVIMRTFRFKCVKQADNTIITSAARSKKKDATKRFFCPSPPPPFQIPPKVHFMCVHAESLTLRALRAMLLQLLTLDPECAVDTGYSDPLYL